MSYSDFTLDRVRKTFGLTISDNIDIFVSIPEVECPPLLTEVLWENVPLALASNTEKSRSEMIITPILIAVRKYLKNQSGSESSSVITNYFNMLVKSTLAEQRSVLHNENHNVFERGLTLA